MSNVEYHRVLAGEKRRIGRGILAIALLVGGLTLSSLVFAAAAAAIEPRIRDGAYTPLLHAAGALSVALIIPWSMVIQRWLYGVPGKSLHSVFARFRFGILGRAVLLIAPAWVAVLVVSDHLAPEPTTTWTHSDELWMLTAILLLTPLQTTGEEYGFRGLILRVAGSWTRGSRSGLVVALIVTFVTFAATHLATDLWLNLWYVVFAVGTGLITWRTGGIEIAVVLHALYNTLGFVFLVALHTDPAVLTDRAAGATTAVTLIPGIVIVATTIVAFWTTRRTGPLRTPA